MSKFLFLSDRPGVTLGLQGFPQSLKWSRHKNRLHRTAPGACRGVVTGLDHSLCSLERKKKHHSQWLTFGNNYGIRGAPQVVLGVRNPPTSAGDIRDAALIPGLGRPPGERHGNPLQYSCLESPHGQRSLMPELQAQRTCRIKGDTKPTALPREDHILPSTWVRSSE